MWEVGERHWMLWKSKGSLKAPKPLFFKLFKPRCSEVSCIIHAPLLGSCTLNRCFSLFLRPVWFLKYYFIYFNPSSFIFILSKYSSVTYIALLSLGHEPYFEECPNARPTPVKKCCWSYLYMHVDVGLHCFCSRNYNPLCKVVNVLDIIILRLTDIILL